MPESAPLLAVEDLVVRFPARDARGRPGWILPVDHVSFTIAPGGSLAVVGESGSGKTTTGKAVVRLLRPFSGRIRFQGQDVARWPARRLAAYHRRVQMIFQDPYGSLNPVKTVAAHLALPLSARFGLRGAALAGRIDRLLHTVDLEPVGEIRAKFPHELSGGQRQRVAIARALAVEPRLLVADEPISMLDVSIRAGILQLLERLRLETGTGLLYITHDLASARYIGQNILVLYGGTVVERGPAGEVVDHPLHPYTRLLLVATPGVHAGEPLPETASTPPDLFAGRQGCVFAPRCPAVMPVCRTQTPGLVTPRPGHQAACHLYPAPDSGRARDRA